MKRIVFASLLMTTPVAASPAVVVRTYPNGLRWIHQAVSHNQIVAMRLLIPGGTSTEPADKAGVTKLMTAVLLKGTQKKNSLAFSQAVEDLGASLDADAQEDAWDMSGQVIADRFATFFDLFQEALLSPAFADDEVSKERAADLNAIRANKEHIFHVADELLRTNLYPGHPYGRSEDGEEKAVAALNREDLVARHRAVVSPKGAVLVTVGDLPVRMVEEKVAALARAWPAPAASLPDAGPVHYPASGILAEEPQHFEQSYLMMAWPAPAFGDPDYAAVKVLNAWLGGGMSSPLFMKVREEAGLAYEVASFYPAQKWGSAFTAYAGMDPANLEAAQSRMEAVIAGAVKAPPSADDLESAKRYLCGHFAMDHQTNGRLAWYLGFYEMTGKGWGYDAKYPEEIRRVTADDVHRVAGKIFGRPPVVVRVRSSK